MNIRVYRTKTGAIEKMALEDYLRGVVPAEIGRDAPDEAMKAQAIVSRTYAYRHILADKAKEYDVEDTVSNQVYKPEKITDRSDAAVRATEGVILVYKDEPVGAWFSSSNGGRIKSSQEKWGGSLRPYSISKADPFDTHGGGGHGVGMSQHGAMAMAKQGYSYRDILDFYWNATFDYKVLPYADTPVPEHGTNFTKEESSMTFTKNLRKGSKGEDVRYVQKRLIELGYDLGSYGADGDFGSKTLAAVKAYQKANKLTADGIVGKKTWAALFAKAETAPAVKPEPVPLELAFLANIGDTAAAAIGKDLAGVTAQRQKIVCWLLQFAYDPEVPQDFPRSLYVWGANLCGTDGTPNIMTALKLRTAFKRYPSHFTTASQGMMQAAVMFDPNLTGSDCSGGIVGMLRHFGFVKGTFDANANGLAGSSHSKSISRSKLQPGDWVGRSGHIGIYVGGGYVVEWYGQDYGCQLTKLGTKRRAWNFVRREFRTSSDWTRYRRPKYY